MQVIVNDQAVQARFKKINQWIRGEVPSLTKAESLMGAKFARQIAPHDTGALIQAIDNTPGKRAGQVVEWLVVSRQPNHPVQGRSRPYHKWINEGLRGWAQGMKTSGEHRYMEATAKYLKGLYSKDMSKSLQKVLK